MTDNADNTPLDQLQAQFDSRVERLSDVETDQLRAILTTYKQRLLEPQWRERNPGFSLAAVLRDLPYRPSVGCLQQWTCWTRGWRSLSLTR